MCTDIEFEEVISNLRHLNRLLGNHDFGPIAEMDILERFRWLAAVRSSIIQTSPTHIGKANNLMKLLNAFSMSLLFKIQLFITTYTGLSDAIIFPC